MSTTTSRQPAAPRLTWTREVPGIYWTQDALRSYSLIGNRSDWTLRSHLIADHGDPHVSEHITGKQGRATVQAFVDLGEDYRPEDHEGRSRWSEAIWRGCNRAARPVAAWLDWCRENGTRYQATDATKRYHVIGSAEGWTLTVNEERVVEGRRQPGTEVLASYQHADRLHVMAVARFYSHLSDGYRPELHGNRDRVAEAVGQASESAAGW